MDWARRLAKRGGKLDEIAAIPGDGGEGRVPRLWEPLAAKRRPPNGYAAKFSQPWCIAYALVHGQVGLEAFADARMADERVAALAAKLRYRVDPQNPYPDEFTGHVELRLADGSTIDERHAHLRGGAREPLTARDVDEKFRANIVYGGWGEASANGWPRLCGSL